MQHKKPKLSPPKGLMNRNLQKMKSIIASIRGVYLNSFTSLLLPTTLQTTKSFGTQVINN